MAALPRLLRRFRTLVTPPGRPAAALGVPASGEDVAAELGALLAELQLTQEEADAIRARAHEDAGRLRERAAREAATIIERAHSTADVERARAASDGRAAVRAREQATRAQADAEVSRIRALSEARLDELVSEVIACVRRSGC